jgi:uncharacterized protein YjlB
MTAVVAARGEGASAQIGYVSIEAIHVHHGHPLLLPLGVWHEDGHLSRDGQRVLDHASGIHIPHEVSSKEDAHELMIVPFPF